MPKPFSTRRTMMVVGNRPNQNSHLLFCSGFSKAMTFMLSVGSISFSAILHFSSPLLSGREESSDDDERVAGSGVARRAARVGSKRLRRHRPHPDPLRQDMAAGHRPLQQVSRWINPQYSLQCRRNQKFHQIGAVLT